MDNGFLPTDYIPRSGAEVFSEIFQIRARQGLESGDRHEMVDILCAFAPSRAITLSATISGIVPADEWRIKYALCVEADLQKEWKQLEKESIDGTLQKRIQAWKAATASKVGDMVEYCGEEVEILSIKRVESSAYCHSGILYKTTKGSIYKEKVICL